MKSEAYFEYRSETYIGTSSEAHRNRQGVRVFTRVPTVFFLTG